MNEFKKFGVRTIFFAFVAIFCALAISDDTEAEYTKYPIWSASVSGCVDDDCYLLDNNLGDSNSEISADGKYLVRADNNEGGYYTSYDDELEENVRTGYDTVVTNYYNNSQPDNTFNKCILGNEYHWSGNCRIASVDISGDGSRIAFLASNRYQCGNTGTYDNVDSYNTTGPCDGYYSERQKNDGWPQGQGYYGYRFDTNLLVYDSLSGNILLEHNFCYNDGYYYDSENYDATCSSIYDSNDHLELSKDGKYVIVHNSYENTVSKFSVVNGDNGPDWSVSLSETFYDMEISENGQFVAFTAGEFLYYYKEGNLVWQSHLFGDAQYMDMSDDGGKLTVATDYMIVYSFASTTGAPLWEYAHYQVISNVKISSIGSHILVSSNSGLLYFSQSSNAPIWITDQGSYGSSISLSYNGLTIFADRYFINSINGNKLWQTSYGYGGFISDEGNFVYTSQEGINFFTVDSQIFYPVAIAGEDTTKKTSQIVQFTGQGTDQDGTIAKFEWDFDGNGVYDWYNHANGLYTYYYNNEGIYAATLRVTDNDGLTSTDTVIITISGVSTGELIDPNDDGEEEDTENIMNNNDDSGSSTSDNLETPPKNAKEDDKGFLPSLGIVTSITVIGIIGWIMRYK